MRNYLIFIPVYNEGKSALDVISGLRKYKDVADILVIDDGSEDETPKLMNQQKDIYYLRNEQNNGYGAALIKGFNYSIEKGYQSVITIDSDKQHQPDEIEKFLREDKRSDYDIISGSRYLDTPVDKFADAPEDRRKVNGRITKKINSITGFQLTDAFCGFKLYKVDSLKGLDLTETGYSMPLQFWLQAWKNNLRVTEVPVELIYIDRNVGVETARKNVWRRYRYYLETMEKELENYENISISSAS